MFRILSPQKVQHPDGYIVQIENRYAAGYFDSDYRASIELDFGENVGVYRDTIKIFKLNNDLVELSLVEVEVIFQRIVDGIKAMGSDVEIC